jgi:hypothetical protein
MKHAYKAFYGALLVLGLAGISPEPALAKGGTHWDSVCNCQRPDSEYSTKRYVREAPRVRTHKRIVNHTHVVKRTRLIQENRLVVHVRPVIHREVIVHRENTVVRNITLHKVNTTNKVHVENRYETVNRYERGSVRVVNEYHNVRGVNCNCGHKGGRGLFEHRSEDGYGEKVSYRE